MAEEAAEKEKIISYGYILGDGSCIEAAPNSITTKISGSSIIDDEVLGSKQIKATDFEYTKDQIAKPLLDPSALVNLLLIDSTHERCVNAKVSDIIGRGYAITKSSDVELDEVESKETLNKNIVEIKRFFKTATPGKNFIQIFRRVINDFESTGDGYFEVVRNLAGYPATLFHADATTMRRKSDFSGYVQIKGNKKTFFQNYGDKVMWVNLNGKWTIKERNFIDPATGKRNNSLGMFKSANEIIHFKEYFSGSPYYGIPDWLPATRAITANRFIGDYNIKFFEHNAIPQYAIVVHGAKLSSELRSLIEQYFKVEVKGKPHKTLIIAIPYKDVEVEFKPLSTNEKDQSFAGYKKDNRDEIMLAHGVHPARIGIIETAQLGSGSGESQIENYKRSIIDPKQLNFEVELTCSLILEGFHVEDVQFKFLDVDTKDKDKEIDIAIKKLDKGLISINEIRTEILHKKIISGGDRPFFIVGQSVVFVDQLGKNNVGSELTEEAEKQLINEYSKVITELRELKDDSKGKD